MQRHQMRHHQPQQHQRHGNHMQGEKPVQGGVRDHEIPTDELGQGLAHHRNRPEQGDDHLRAPVGHLPPRQQVTHEGLSHQHEENEYAEDPYQFARLAVGTIEQATEHVQIDHDEEHRGTRRMHVADEPTPVHITHDVFDGGKGVLGTGLVVHGQPDAGEQLVDQHHQGQAAEEVPEIKVLGRVIFGRLFLPHLGERKAAIDPIQAPQHQLTGIAHHTAHQAAPLSSPITTRVSPTKR